MGNTSEVAIAVCRTPKEALHVALSKLSEPLIPSLGSSTVVIKPSIYDPQLVGNTSLAMASAVIDLFRKSFLVKVVESDNPVRTAEEAFKGAGYEILKTNEVQLVSLTSSPSSSIKMPGYLFDDHLMPSILLDHLFLVNVATAKLESEICTVGAGIKNLFGLLPEPDKSPYHREINRALMDILHLFRPALTVLDLTEVVVGSRLNGVTKHVGGVIVGTDPVAVDAYCATLMGLEPLEIPYLKLAYDAGLGEAIIDRIQILGSESQIRRLNILMGL